MKIKFKSINSIIVIISFFLTTSFVYGQTIGNMQINPDTSNSKYKDMGVAISPASMHLNLKTGTSTTKEITINNDTKKINKFRIGFSDFIMGTNGKPTNSPKESKYALSKYINITPTFVELKPGEVTKVKLIITIPDTATYSAWTIITVDQETDRMPLDGLSNNKSIAMGVTSSIGFGVYVYQNPPNVTINSVEILNFYIDYNEKDHSKDFVMEVKNTGDGIGYTAAYVELVNLNDGNKIKIPAITFTVLPQFTRLLKIKMPSGLTSGKYSAIGVIDFGSTDQINGQELEFTIP